MATRPQASKGRGRGKRSLPRCARHAKRRFPDHESAIDALHGAAADRARKGEASRRRECRAYFCTDCRGWHLTSQELSLPWVPRSAWTVSSAPHTLAA